MVLTSNLLKRVAPCVVHKCHSSGVFMTKLVRILGKTLHKTHKRL